jgi:hypothetical protein
MAARVDEGTHTAVGLAHREHRDAGDLDRAVRARCRHVRRQRDDDGGAAEDPIDLAGPAILVEVVAHVDGAHVGRRVRRAGFQVVEEPRRQLVPVVRSGFGDHLAPPRGRRPRTDAPIVLRADRSVRP